MSTIQNIIAREILDSRGNPTVEVDLTTELGTFRAAVPSGASTGIYEALELRDGDKSRYGGKGVLTAIQNIENIIFPAIKGRKVVDQVDLDKYMVEVLDGSKNEWGWSKAKLGANAILAVSMAICRAGAADRKMPLYTYIRELRRAQIGTQNIPTSDKYIMPVPSLNVINGGSHAGNALSCQEFMILPTGASSFSEAMKIGAEVYQHLKKVVSKKYGQDATNVGDEGGFAVPVLENDEALEILMLAIQNSGHADKVKIGTDVAASEFYKAEENLYDLGFKNSEKVDSLIKTGDEMINYYQQWIEKYPLVSIEDPFDQDDWTTYQKFTNKSNVQIVGDDLFVTNPVRVSKGIEEKSANALLLKINQIGTITESIDACVLSQGAGWGVMVSHRSGETEDCFISHMVVGLETGQIKTGAPCRSERLAKYNELLRIEEELKRAGKDVVFAGEKFRFPCGM